jgi:hypothetical protein
MLDTALEAVFLLISAFQPQVADYLVIAGAHCVQATPKPRIEWLLGILTTLAILASIASPISPYLETTPHTPYSLLGVTTTSSTAQITHAYHDLVHRTQTGIQLGTVADVSQLTAYRGAYEILTDPLQRCVYHRDNELPDWYGVPKLCWGELAVDRLQAAKGVVRARMGSNLSFESKVWGSRETASAPAESVQGGGVWTWLWTVPTGTLQQGVSWVKSTPKVLSAAIKASLALLTSTLQQGTISWVKSTPRVLLATAVKGWVAFTSIGQQGLAWFKSLPEVVPAAIKVWFLALMGKWQQGLSWFQSTLVVLITAIRVWAALMSTWEQWAAWLALIPFSAISVLITLALVCLLAVIIYFIPNKANRIRDIRTAVTSSRLWVTLRKAMLAGAERSNEARKWLQRGLLDIIGTIARNAVVRMLSDIIGTLAHSAMAWMWGPGGGWWVA